MDEQYAYDASGKSVKLPNVGSSTDCLGKILNNFGVSASSLSISYDSGSDSINLSVEGQDISLKKCPSKVTIMLPKLRGFLATI